MKKIIIALVVVSTTGFISTITRNNAVKAEKIATSEQVYDRNVSLGTAD